MDTQRVVRMNLNAGGALEIPQVTLARFQAGEEVEVRALGDVVVISRAAGQLPTRDQRPRSLYKRGSRTLR